MTYLPSLPAKGEVFGPKIMLTVGSSTVMIGQRLGVGQVGDRLAYLRVFEAREGHDVPRAHLVGLDALQSEVREGLRDARLGHRAVLVDQVARTRRVPDAAAPHAADHDASQVLGVVEVGDQHLERGGEVGLGRRDLLQDGLEELAHVVPWGVHVLEGPALARHGVEDREVELLVRGAEVGHQVEGEVDDLFGPGVWRSILLMTTMGLRPSSMALRSTKRVWGIGPSTASTSSRQPSTMPSTRSTSPPKSVWPGVSTMLILTPSYSTAVFLARMVMPRSRSRTFDVHGALGYLLPVAELEGLLEHAVHEGGLAVVDVRDDGNIAIVHVFSWPTLPNASLAPCWDTRVIKETKSPSLVGTRIQSLPHVPSGNGRGSNRYGTIRRWPPMR